MVSVTSFGIFIELENTVEGFVSFNDMPDDYFMYNENRHMLIGEKTGITYKIGDKLKVELIRSDVLTKQIDFEVI